MSEIKFRAWHLIRGEMIYNFHRVSFCQNNEFHQLLFLNKNEEYGAIDEIQSADYNHLKFLQYTGRKDKNGKEIYKGDIMRSMYGEIGVMGRGESCGCCGKVYGFTISPEMSHEFSEVIGNIYENPELLEKE